MKKLIIITMVTAVIAGACNNQPPARQKELIIFHAGSLSVPLKKISHLYMAKNPDVKIFMESAGSLVCARKVTELKKPCDIIASSDYFVINQLLIPDYATWGIRFATNEIVIAYLDKSKYSGELNRENWMEILQRKDVIYSRSDPDADPCGYRTIFTLMLAERYYSQPGLAEMMISKNKEFIRPKEVDLVALLESNAIDYMFQYRSVAVQHNMKYLQLPPEINLSDPSKNNIYSTVSIEIAGSKPGSKMKVTGDYINYSITVLDKAPQKEEAVDFLDFLLGPAGMETLRENGQDPIVPFSTEESDKLPKKLLRNLRKNDAN